MYTILMINFAIGVLAITLAKCIVYIATQNLRQEYPNITFQKSSAIVRISAAIRIFIFAFTPILNIILLLGLCIRWDKEIENAEDKLWEKVENY